MRLALPRDSPAAPLLWRQNHKIIQRDCKECVGNIFPRTPEIKTVYWSLGETLPVSLRVTSRLFYFGSNNPIPTWSCHGGNREIRRNQPSIVLSRGEGPCANLPCANPRDFGLLKIEPYEHIAFVRRVLVLSDSIPPNGPMHYP